MHTLPHKHRSYQVVWISLTNRALSSDRILNYNQKQVAATPVCRRTAEGENHRAALSCIVSSLCVCTQHLGKELGMDEVVQWCQMKESCGIFPVQTSSGIRGIYIGNSLSLFPHQHPGQIEFIIKDKRKKNALIFKVARFYMAQTKARLW